MNEKLELRRIVQSSNATLYEIPSSDDIDTFIISTPQTIQILNHPEICGISFQKMLSSALHTILDQLYKMGGSRLAVLMRSSPIDIFYILRGGLNFDLHRSFAEVTFSLPEVTFLSSQRVASNSGFEIGESGYRKWSIQDEALLCVGDISATATTLKHVLDEAILRYSSERKKPKGLVVFTIGTSHVRDMLISYQEKLKEVWSPDFQGTTLVFLEEIFHLYTGEPSLAKTHLPFTDFFRKDFPSSLEFENESLSEPVCFLERCAIYDGGSRSFEPSVYLRNLHNYWASLKEDSNLTVMRLLELKSNLVDYRYNFEEWLQKRHWWAKIDENELRLLHAKGQRSLTDLTSRSLAEISEGRLNMIKQ